MSPTYEKEILEHVMALKATVGELKGTVDESLPSITTRLNDHTRRIRNLEHYAWILVAAVTILGILLYNVSTVHTFAETIEKHRAATEQSGRNEVNSADHPTVAK